MNSLKVSRPFSSTKAVSELLIILLGASAAIDLVAIGIDSYHVMLLSGSLSAGTSESTIEGIGRIMGAIQFVLHIFAWGFFLFWFYRAHRNLPSLGVLRGKYSSPWSIVLFFVPIVNFYFGYDLVRELWKQSNPDVGFSDDFLRRHASPLKQYPSKTALIGFWWGFTWVSTRLASGVFKISLHSTSASDYIKDTVGYMISQALGIVGSILLIVIVTKIDERQEEKHRRLTEPSAVAPG
jgi:hypothetical protein